MKEMVEHLLNKIQKEELELLFGEGSVIKVNSIKFSTNNKTYVIDTTVFVSDIENSIESFPNGVDFLIKEGWKYIGLENNLTIINKLDVI